MGIGNLSLWSYFTKNLKLKFLGPEWLKDCELGGLGWILNTDWILDDNSPFVKRPVPGSWESRDSDTRALVELTEEGCT